MTYQVQLVWNREFDWCHWGDPWDRLENAIEHAKTVENSGDGARVKKTRVVDEDGKVVWAYGRLVK